MKKSIIFILITIYVSKSLAQTFNTVDYERASNLVDTFPKNINTNQLKYLLNHNYDIDNMVDKYKNIVFIKQNKYKITQWNSDLRIYLSKNIPKKVRKEITRFFSSNDFNSIQNLKISFVNKLSKANYYVKVVDYEINGYNKDYYFSNDERRNKHILTGATYNLITDNNYKFYGCTLRINPKNIESDIDYIRRLKRLIFKSLGNFIGINFKNNNSLLNYNYLNETSLSDFDKSILNIHYQRIYNSPINLKKFNQLIEVAKNH